MNFMNHDIDVEFGDVRNVNHFRSFRLGSRSFSLSLFSFFLLFSPFVLCTFLAWLEPGMCMIFVGLKIVADTYLTTLYVACI